MPVRGIVLGGGGARGPYEVGVWQAMRQLGMDYQIVTGTSVGALNGALMVQDSFDLAKEMWESLEQKDVIAEFTQADPATLPGRGRMMADFVRQMVERGGLDTSPLEAVVRRAVNEEVLRASPVQFGLVTVRFPSLKAVQLTKEEILPGSVVDYLLASASFFPFFQRRTIGEDAYVDGALSDNMPIQLAVRCGAEEIIAVDLGSAGVVHNNRINVPVTYIRSHWDLGQLLRFQAETARYNLRLGYLDGLKAFHRLEGCAYAFKLGESSRNARDMGKVLAYMHRTMGVSVFDKRKRLPLLAEPRIGRWIAGGGAENPTFGRALTTAAEITGELLGMPPEEIYDFPSFNALLRERFQRIREEKQLPAPALVSRKGKLSRAAMCSMVDMLEAGVSGPVPEALWPLTAVSPKEFVAANYLCALGLLERQETLEI